MPAKVKGFAYGTILTTIGISIFLGMMSWFTVQVVSIPVMKNDISNNKEFKTTITKLSTETTKLRVTINSLTTQAIRTNDILQAYVQSNSTHLRTLYEADTEARVRLDYIERRCTQAEKGKQ